MSTILASAATLLALIFSAPVLCAPAARAPVVTSSAATVLPGRYQMDDGTETEVLLHADGSFQHGSGAQGTWSVDGDTVTLAGSPPGMAITTLRSDGMKLLEPAG